MAAPTLAEFLARFPDLAIHSEEVIVPALALAGRVCDETIWGELHGDGVAFYAAHLITSRVREVGQTLGKPSGQPNGEGTKATYYGQQYEALRALLPATGFVI
jgi:hypothetical protein